MVSFSVLLALRMLIADYETRVCDTKQWELDGDCGRRCGNAAADQLTSASANLN